MAQVFLSNITAVVMDIEGTTTSISFVKDTLFPYVRRVLPAYLDEFWGSDQLQVDIEALRQQANEDFAAGVADVPVIAECAAGDAGNKEQLEDSIIANVLWQMDKDRKTTALKQLQGHIWCSGYANGQLVGHIYEDVVPALRTWTNLSMSLYIYSSGSVEAQTLLFSHTAYGDLTELISGNYDTRVGAKGDAGSYRKILSDIQRQGSNVLFLTDVPREAYAAREAGLNAILVVREGNAPLTDDEKSDFTRVNSFSQLILSSN